MHSTQPANAEERRSGCSPWSPECARWGQSSPTRVRNRSQNSHSGRGPTAEGEGNSPEEVGSLGTVRASWRIRLYSLGKYGVEDTVSTAPLRRTQHALDRPAGKSPAVRQRARQETQHTLWLPYECSRPLGQSTSEQLRAHQLAYRMQISIVDGIPKARRDFSRAGNGTSSGKSSVFGGVYRAVGRRLRHFLSDGRKLLPSVLQFVEVSSGRGRSGCILLVPDGCDGCGGFGCRTAASRGFPLLPLPRHYGQP